MVVTSSASQNDSLDWEELLPKIEFLLNTTWQSSIGCTPFEVLLRQKLNLHVLGPVSFSFASASGLFIAPAPRQAKEKLSKYKKQKIKLNNDNL